MKQREERLSYKFPASVIAQGDENLTMKNENQVSLDAITCRGLLANIKGIPLACEICGKKEYLGAHHILSKREGGKDVPENLALLCDSCHSRLHGWDRSKWGPLTREDKEFVEKYSKLYIKHRVSRR